MQFHSLALVASLAALQGCTTFKFDHVAPTGDNVARVSVTSAWDGFNQRVIVHGARPCHPDDAKLAGLINAGAVGQAKVQQLDFLVPAGEDVRISLPQIDLVALRTDAATFRYCQPVVLFRPVAGARYLLHFGACRGDAFLVTSDAPGGAQRVSGEPDRTCAVTAEDRGKDGKIFYLTDRAAPVQR